MWLYFFILFACLVTCDIVMMSGMDCHAQGKIHEEGGAY